MRLRGGSAGPLAASHFRARRLARSRGPQVAGEETREAAWPFSPTDRPTKIVCVGRNWAEHARELGHRIPDEPILFLKPPSALLGDGDAIRLPAGVGRVDHEVELGVVIGARLRDAGAEQVEDGVRGWCLALDLTARELQQRAKKAGRPWCVAKGYDGFCPVSAVVPRDALDPAAASLRLDVDGTTRQDGNTRDMLWSVPVLLAHISTIMTLEPGDLVLTGTPPGVGPLAPGQRVEAWLDGTRRLVHDVR